MRVLNSVKLIIEILLQLNIQNQSSEKNRYYKSLNPIKTGLNTLYPAQFSL